MREEAKKTEHEAELAGQATRERGAMPREDQGAEVAGHMKQPLAPEGMDPAARTEKERRPEAEKSAQRGAPQQTEQAI